MMQKTVKKNKKEGSGKRLSYVVTENGLVENDEDTNDTSHNRRGERKGSKSLIASITEVADARQKFKALGNRRKSSLHVSETEDAKKKESLIAKAKDPKAALAEINAAESERRKKSISTGDIADTKRILGAVPKKKGSREGSISLVANPRDSKVNREDTEEDENEIGLLEADAMRKRIQQIGSTLLTTKAIATMSAPRRQRSDLINSVKYA